MAINNQIYDTYGDRWYTAKDDPIALLRAESRLRNPWILEKIEDQLGQGPKRVLDIGCGAGFLSNALALGGHSVIGIDLSAPSLEVAKRHDPTGTVNYVAANAYRLNEAYSGAFDVVCAMDFLEHVELPSAVVIQAAQCLKPGGIFFFHTFNRNPLSWLIAIKGVEWFVSNTPKDLHVHKLFITPSEMMRYLRQAGFEFLTQRGVRPVLNSAFWKMLRSGVVEDEFTFEFTPSCLVGYTGMARKNS